MAVCFPGFSVGMITHPVTTGKSSLIRNSLMRKTVKLLLRDQPTSKISGAMFQIRPKRSIPIF